MTASPAADGTAPVGPLPVWHSAVISLGVALLAALVTLVIFSPRFMVWQALVLPQKYGGVETHRAYDTRIQLQDPWAPVPNPSNKVIQWRLFFPVVWHYLGLPWKLYLGLPQLGCVLALWLVAFLNHQRLANWWQTLMATMLFAALPWFFVSSGWLTYFDSWLVLGLLITAFVPSRVLLGLVSLIEPWIDERFVLALPLVFLVRVVALAHDNQRSGRDLLLDAAVILVASLPYPAVRALAWLHGDADSKYYVNEHWKAAWGVPLTRYLEGIWSGYRAAWLFVGAAVWFVCRRANWAVGVLFAVAVIGTSLGGLVVAADMSRTLMMECVVMLLGVWLFQEANPANLPYVLAAVLIANLVLPAEHVIWPFKVPIQSFYTEFRNFSSPDTPYQPARYVDLALRERDSQDFETARMCVNAAIEAEPDFVRAYVIRSILSLDVADFAGAIADADTALRLAPDQPDALTVRAAARLRLGETAAAVNDLRKALESAPAKWSQRSQAESLLKHALETTAPVRTPFPPSPN